MKNVFFQNLDQKRYAEITKPLYKTAPDIPLSVVNAGFANVFTKYNSSPVLHRGFTCMFVTKGRGKVRIEDEAFVLQSGDLLCYRTNNTKVHIEAEIAPWEYRWIEVAGSTAPFYYKKLCHQNYPRPQMRRFSADRFWYYYNRLLQNLFSTHETAEYTTCGILNELFVAMLTETAALPPETGKNAANFSRLFGFMEKNYFNPLTVEDLAQVFGFSKYHFIRVFKAHSQMTPMQYLTNFRMGKASELLLSSDRSVEEISEIVGYKTPSRFIAHFKEIVGTTPLQYRKQHKK